MNIIALDMGIISPGVLPLRDEWLRLKGDERIPLWTSFDMIACPELIPHMAILDVEWEPLTFRYALIGSLVIDIAERDVTGQKVDEALYPNNLDHIIWPYEKVARSGEPAVTLGPVEFVDKPWTMIENLYLPFASENGTLSKILCCVMPTKESIEIGEGVDFATLDWTRP